VFLVGIIAAGLAIPASASVPEKHYTRAVPELTLQIDPQASSFENFRRELMSPTLDPHPFSNEFYLREFARETAAESRHWHLRVNPMLTSAASGLSKKVASLRRALARMMP
jgi:hypothetical protein